MSNVLWRRIPWTVGLTAGLLALVGSSASAADSCPNAGVRTGLSAGLPDCRGYEQVSPADKVGGAVNFGEGLANGMTLLAPDGDHAIFNSYFAFADAQGVTANSYRAQRTTDGWRTTTVSPPPGEDATIFNGRGTAVDASDDLATAIFETGSSIDPGDQDAGIVDVYARRGDGPVEWISRPRGVGSVIDDGAENVGHSADGDHILFESTESLVPLPPGGPQVAGTNLYDSSGGVLRLVGVKSDGSLQSPCGAKLGATQVQARTSRGISADGSVIAFVSPDPAAAGSPGCPATSKLYLRIDGDTTTEVATNRSSTPSDPDELTSEFLAMTPDGSHVFFRANQRLTDDAPLNGGVYRYDVDDDALSFIDDQAQLLTVSDDGARVYMISATSQLLLVDAAQRTVIADGLLTGLTSGEPGFSSTPDGSHFAFQTSDPVTGYDSHGTQQVYTWQVGGTLRCVSCPSDGAAPAGDSSLGSYKTGAGQGYNQFSLRRNFSIDGTHLVFESKQRLDPRDANGATDVYDATTGGVRLISSGVGQASSKLVSIGATGRDILFSSSVALVTQDDDGGAIDLYDARVGGGFAPTEQPSRCTGDQCQAPPTAPGPPPAAATISFVGAGPADPPQRVVAGRVTFRSPTTTVRGTRFSITVKTPGPGRITGSGSSVRSVSRTARRAASYHLPVSLTSAAARKLQRNGNLAVSVRMRFAPSSGEASTRTIRVSVTRPRKDR